MGKEELVIRLKELRTESKLTQTQIAEYLGIDQSFVAKIENGQRSMSLTMLNKLCNLFGCSEAYLLGEDTEYVPLNCAFRANVIELEDMESIAAVNRIVLNLRYMNDVLGEEK